MRNLICLIGFALTVATSPLQAGSLVLKYEGVLDYGSYDESGNDLAGLAFEVNAVFDSTPFDTDIGTGWYEVTSLSATVAGVSYVETDPAYFEVELYDPSAGFLYMPILVGDFEFWPVFGTATPEIAGDAASPTVFSDYYGSFESEMELLTASGFVTLVYDDSYGLSVSISEFAAVPEPSTAILALMGGLGCSFAARRRKLASAA